MDTTHLDTLLPSLTTQELVAAKLLGRVTTKDDGDWGKVLWNSASYQSQAHKGASVRLNIARTAALYELCHSAPRCSYVIIYPDGTVIAHD